MTHYQDSCQLDIRADYRLPSAPKGTPSVKKEPTFILKPTLPEVFTKDDIDIIEEVVRDSRLVDKGIRELKKLSANAPSFDPERRRFFKHVAVLAGLYASGQLLKGCAIAQEPGIYQGKTYTNWEAYSLTQDLIRGPRLLINPRTGLPSDFKDHQKEAVYRGREGNIKSGVYSNAALYISFC